MTSFQPSAINLAHVLLLSFICRYWSAVD